MATPIPYLPPRPHPGGRCDPDCPGWFLNVETRRIESCDDCYRAAGLDPDDDLATRYAIGDVTAAIRQGRTDWRLAEAAAALLGPAERERQPPPDPWPEKDGAAVCPECDGEVKIRDTRDTDHGTALINGVLCADWETYDEHEAQDTRLGCSGCDCEWSLGSTEL